MTITRLNPEYAAKSHTHQVSDVTNLGTVYNSGEKSGLSVAANQDTFTDGAKVTLPAGVYVVRGYFAFGSASSTPSSTSIRLKIGTSTSYMHRTRGYDSYWSAMYVTEVLTLSAQTDVYVCGSSSVARTGCQANIRAVRVA